MLLTLDGPRDSYQICFWKTGNLIIEAMSDVSDFGVPHGKITAIKKTYISGCNRSQFRTCCTLFTHSENNMRSRDSNRVITEHMQIKRINKALARLCCGVWAVLAVTVSPAAAQKSVPPAATPAINTTQNHSLQDQVIPFDFDPIFFPYIVVNVQILPAITSQTEAFQA